MAEIEKNAAAFIVKVRVSEDDRSGQFRRLASQLRVDNIKLRQLLAHVPPPKPDPAGSGLRRRGPAPEASQADEDSAPMSDDD
jgi:phosphoenolpyruvate carboxylase